MMAQTNGECSLSGAPLTATTKKDCNDLLGGRVLGPDTAADGRARPAAAVCPRRGGGGEPHRGAAVAVANLAKLRMSGTVTSGSAFAGGVAPKRSRPARRSIHTVVSPTCLAGTWSWNRLWATC